jgi:GNAT superfamily N-acetyltransferase
MAGLTMKIEDSPDKEDVQAIYHGLDSYNMLHAQAMDYRPLVVFLRDEAGKIVGGLAGETYWGWLHVDALWVDQAVRGQDYGSQLLEIAEQEARQRGCMGAHLDTMSFQAQPFYEKHGYTVWGVLDDLPEGHRRIYMKKKLS